MPIEMERPRDCYRGRYRDRHYNDSTVRNNHDDRSTRGSYRGHSSRYGNYNGHYSSRNSPHDSYNYRSSRTSFNFRSVSSRVGTSSNCRYRHNDDYDPSSSNRANSSNSSQSTYHGNHSLSSRFDRSSNHHEVYQSLPPNQLTVPNGPPLQSSSSYYGSQLMPPVHDLRLLLPRSQYVDSERNRHIPSLSSTYRRNSLSPPISSYRNERSIDYGPRNTTSDMHMRNEYRPSTLPSLVPLSMRADTYDDIYRANDHDTRSERYDAPFNRDNALLRDHPIASMSSSICRADLYRSSSNVSISPSPSSYLTCEQYIQDVNLRPMSQSRDYRSTLSSSSSFRTSCMPTMYHREGSSRNARNRIHNDYHSSNRDRPNLKRSASKYNDNGPIPSKRSTRR